MPRSELPQPRFAILGSGRGSNAAALMAAFRSGAIPAELVAVYSNVAGAPILEKAVAHGYAAELVASQGRTRTEQERELLDRLRARNVEHLLLAGYMRVLSPEFIRDFAGVILNIHPALLPDFPGRTAVVDQWRAGVRVSGATVHFVDEGIDTGPILLSGSIDVRGDESADQLADRIRTEVEHVLYPRAVRLLLERMQRQGPLGSGATR